jgi:F-type H+-transporting ATPase subunit epsilon
MRLRIISPRGALFEGEVQRVLLPGEKAPFVLLHSHAPLISSLTTGKIAYTTPSGQVEEIAVEGGFVEIKNDTIVVCTE